VDEVIARRLLQVVAPEEIALALAAADEVADRYARSRRALELRVERAQYEAVRAERAFHRCDPENRLVARSLEHRWETRLNELAEAERELTCDTRKRPMPPRDEIEALAQDLPRLWAAPTTSAKDRKRLVRALVADVTLRSDPTGPQLGIGIRWRSGATEEVIALRSKSAADSRRTPSAVVEFVRRLTPERSDAEIAETLNAEGKTTGLGRPFDIEAVRWVRFAHRIPSRPLLATSELTVSQVAMIVVRYADDFIVGFQHRADAERFRAELRERLAKFNLELHSEKTRLLEFGPFATENRQRVGQGKPETFDFLGFTHICGKKRNGRFTVVRQTIRKRVQAKLSAVKAELRRRWHDPIPVVGAWLGQVVSGHTRYYGVPMNSAAIVMFRLQVGWLWHRALARRSHTGHVSWERMRRLIERWLPPARICHPYPLRRLGVIT
jgi:hypothetical protein